MDIEAVKTRCAAATEGPWHWPDGTGIWAENAKRHVSELPNLAYGDGQFIAHARTDLPDAIELIERMEELLRVVSMQSEHVDCDGPGCWWCGAECGTPHTKACAVDAVLAKVGSTKKSP